MKGRKPEAIQWAKIGQTRDYPYSGKQFKRISRAGKRGVQYSGNP
jgi:hypothetical protein